MPEILLSPGDIFASGCEALVNPVDTTAAMGAGLALAFTKRFSQQTTWYREHARRGFAEAGSVYHVLPRRDEERLSAARWVLERHRAGGRAQPLVLFATTKASWKKPSDLRWVIGCCQALVDVVAELGIRSIGIPALGCGEGKLSWTDVRPLLLGAAQQMQCERVVVFEPR
jgi:O-acetyl-ADP-ribose deacetylase (regulator of RNase III)